MQQNQLEMFEETLDKKIQRMDRWILRLQKEMWFLKEVYKMHQRQNPKALELKKEEQFTMFGT